MAAITEQVAMAGVVGAEDAGRLRRAFTDFLDSSVGRKDYSAQVKELVDGLIKGEEKRLYVDLGDFRSFDGGLAKELIDSPSDCIEPFEEALKEVCLNIDPKLSLVGSLKPRLGFVGGFGFNAVTPRELLAPLMGSLVKVEGIVTKCSLVRPKVISSVHFCSETKKFLQRQYRDVTSHSGLPTGASYPTRDEHGNLLTTEYGLSDYEDHQVVTVQEMPEDAPPGQLPRSVDVLCEADLVDKCKPGDRVAICGVYKAVPVKGNSNLSGVFRTVLVSNAVNLLSKDISAPKYTADDLKQIKKLGKKSDIMKILASSVAPSIFGHHHIKTAMVLVLAGGVEKNLENGTHLRGDINMLMVGDPGVAKSQMLRAIMGLAPLSVATTGRGSSGVGLTAAVTTDSDTGDRRLEAGAMVLADRGIVCIDEFDKMSELDRVAIHEVMEQQTVTIAKAGIHTSLNARCSVVAAANPVYGSYDHTMSITRNVALPDSLLSRFDLLFIVLDNMTANSDRDMSEHVLRMHKFRGADAEISGNGFAQRQRREALADDDEDDEEIEDHISQVFVKYDRVLHGEKRGHRQQQLLTVRFLRKYIKYCKDRFNPVLGSDACAAFTAAYTSMRLDQTDKTLPVTARTLETMIRLASAHAKLHMRREVSGDDASAALDLMRFAIYAEDKNVGEKEPKKARKAIDVAETPTRPLSSSDDRSRQQEGDTTQAQGQNGNQNTRVEPQDGVEVSREVHDKINKIFVDLLARERQQHCTFEDLLTAVQASVEGGSDIESNVVEAVVRQMSDAGKVMFAEGVIYVV